MDDEQARCILENQTEIMGALSLLLRFAAPNLVGRAGELDRQRDDLYQRHKATMRALSSPPLCPECEANGLCAKHAVTNGNRGGENG